MEVLLIAGEVVNSKLSIRQSLATLRCAAIGGNFEIARLLLNNNAEVNTAASEERRTALARNCRKWSHRYDAIAAECWSRKRRSGMCAISYGAGFRS